jgi:hypothetical protein
VRYAIVVRGPVGPLARTALEGFEVVDSPPGQVRLEGAVVDEDALHGVLHRLQDHRLDLLAVERLDAP